MLFPFIYFSPFEKKRQRQTGRIQQPKLAWFSGRVAAIYILNCGAAVKEERYHRRQQKGGGERRKERLEIN